MEIQRVLLPTDFSEYSRFATSAACGIAERFDAELHLLYVFEHYTGSKYVRGLPLPESGSYIDNHIQQVADSLAHWIDSDWASRNRVIRATAEGHPFVEIVRYADEQQIDLIVMGTHGRSGIPHMLMGSVAEKVVRKAPCAVMTVRPEGHKYVPP